MYHPHNFFKVGIKQLFNHFERPIWDTRRSYPYIGGISISHLQLCRLWPSFSVQCCCCLVLNPILLGETNSLENSSKLKTMEPWLQAVTMKPRLLLESRWKYCKTGGAGVKSFSAWYVLQEICMKHFLYFQPGQSRAEYICMDSIFDGQHWKPELYGWWFLPWVW